MTFNVEKHRHEWLFLPLGGSGEIGMNLNLYYYKGKWLMVDLGAGFADSYLPGVDMIVPDISFIAKHKEDLVGLVLTHAHEDHLGAVQYLWEELECPIYTTPFTAAFLRAKLAEMPFAKKVSITEINIGGQFALDPFKIEMVPLTHSAPEMQALVIRTELGNVLHTGDWKFDHDPLIGSANDEAALKKYGDEGILALIGDSTNVFNPGTSGSEGDLRKSLVSLVAGCPKLVAVTTFASNIARIETIAHAAKACGRNIILAGRSLWRVVRAAQETGYLQDITFYKDTDMKRFSREEVLLLCTGCQGEALAAVMKMANQNHPTLRLTTGDTVIFSSKIIPGNEKRIFWLFNQFLRMGVEVLTEKDHFVHVSGHPAREELQKMYQLVRPQVAIPVHGEVVHMHEHAKRALEWGVPQAIEVENGDVVRLAPGTPEKVAMVKAGYLAIDGYYLLEANGPVMRARRRLQRDGMVIVTLLMQPHGELRADPLIYAPGCLDAEEDRDLLLVISDEIIEALEQQQRQSRKLKGIQEETMKNVIRSAVKRILKREVGKNPSIEVHFVRL